MRFQRCEWETKSNLEMEIQQLATRGYQRDNVERFHRQAKYHQALS